MPASAGSATARLQRRMLATAGAVARHVPHDGAQLFAFMASPAVRADPWSLYQRLHRRGAVRPTVNQAWLVGSHRGVTQLLRAPAVSVVESFAPPQATRHGDDPFTAFMDRTLLFTDPPDHTRLRRLIVRAFTPRTVEALRPSVEALVETTLARLRPRGAGDLVAELALPLPVAVICELIGVPGPERPRFLRWARHIGPRLEITLFRDPEAERRGNEATLELTAFLDELAADPARRHPDGLLGALLAVEEQGDRLDRGEVVNLCMLLLVAGFETTTNLIGNGLLALLGQPDQLRRVRDGDVAPATAVEELLRYAGPSQFTQRVPLEDVDVEGHHIPSHTLVALLNGAANRDPAVFAQPDRLDVGRTPNPHVAFGGGIHHCLGAALARLEAGIAIPAVLRALPDLRLARRPRWRDTFVIRGLRSLPVAWTPA